MNSDRYSRQELFSPIGQEGQATLANSHVLIIGAGALGASSSEQLVRAGVGRITLVDRDYVDWSNLQRQQLYTEQDVIDHMPKALAAKQRLQAINSSVEVIGHVMDAQQEELEQLVQDVDFIMDATDNFETRLLINDVAQKHQVPWSYGACVSSHGVCLTILPGKTPCLSCLIDSIPMGAATCDTAGVISPAVHMVTAHQVTDALKILTGNEAMVDHKLVTFDLWTHRYTRIGVMKAKRSDCLSCGEHPTFPYLSKEKGTRTAVLCGRNTVQIRPSDRIVRDLDALYQKLPADQTERTPFLLMYKQEPYRIVFFQDGRALIHGTKDVTEARRIYHKVVGG